jgi:N-acetylmuramoyl-L-alanine amidase
VEWWWRRWVPVAAWVALTAGPGVSGAVELRRIEAVPSPAGVTIRLVLSGHVPATVRELPPSTEAGERLYLDLPRGTRLGPGVIGATTAVAPVTSLRAGIGDGGAARVVVEVAEPVTYRMRGGRSTVTLDLTRTTSPTGPAEVEPGPPAPAAPTAHALAARPKIVIDPGHGGRDPGARGYAVEKDVTLVIARRLAGLLRERLGAEVILTRTDDTFLPLAARTARANTEGADLFLSIHANASPHGSLHGVETYYLNNAGDRASMRLAAMENGLDLIAPGRGQTDLRYILSDLVQVGKMEESINLARAVQGGLVHHLRDSYAGVSDLGVKQGPFYVLVGAYMPCALVETSFLTHPAEGRRLAGRTYRTAVAEGLYRGVARFLADAQRARTL